MNTTKEKKKNLLFLILLVIIVGLLIAAPRVFSGICAYYERHWYQIISDEKLKKVSYQEMLAYVGEPIYTMPAEENSKICVYSPYHRFGFFGHCISKLRGQPTTAIVFINDKYSMMFFDLGSGESEGTGLIYEVSPK